MPASRDGQSPASSRAASPACLFHCRARLLEAGRIEANSLAQLEVELELVRALRSRMRWVLRRCAPGRPRERPGSRSRSWRESGRSEGKSTVAACEDRRAPARALRPRRFRREPGIRVASRSAASSARATSRHRSTSCVERAGALVDGEDALVEVALEPVPARHQGDRRRGRSRRRSSPCAEALVQAAGLRQSTLAALRRVVAGQRDRPAANCARGPAPSSPCQASSVTRSRGAGGSSRDRWPRARGRPRRRARDLRPRGTPGRAPSGSPPATPSPPWWTRRAPGPGRRLASSQLAVASDLSGGRARGPQRQTVGTRHDGGIAGSRRRWPGSPDRRGA